MAAVRSLRVSVKSDCGSERSESDSDSDRDGREAEPMEVEEGEVEAENVSVNRSLKELLPDTSRRYENKAGAFITGIDVNSKVKTHLDPNIPPPREAWLTDVWKDRMRVSYRVPVISSTRCLDDEM
ncbi:Nuclear cap-binding protein subunit 3 [Ilyodon furcidens]|uniref:Nuclear cap-binding protein subunit 3 n=1 Tax=Ilyodon furcidens TaxID=33524 RepID=A0ABV0TGE3_9TELE